MKKIIGKSMGFVYSFSIRLLGLFFQFALSIAPSKLSVMPDDVLNQLTKAEIADLFAFLETSKTGPTLETSPPSGGTGTGKTK